MNKDQEQNLAKGQIPVLFQIDPITREATGTVMPFCSRACRAACSEHGLGDAIEGVSNVSDFGYEIHCEQCGRPAFNPSPMTIVVEQYGQTVVGHGFIRDNVVYQGKNWHPGAEVIGFTDFKNECICCAINEGSQLHGSFEDDADGQDGLSPWSFRIVAASSEDLGMCQLLSSLPYEGAKITTADGYTFFVVDGAIVDNPDPEFRDLTYKTLAEVKSQFSYSVAYTSNQE